MDDRRAVLITGAGAGIGKAIARLFAAQGARVAVVDLDEDRSDQTVAEIDRDSGVGLSVRADVTIPDDVQRAFRAAEQAFGVIDVLVNNAYSCDSDDLQEATATEWEQDVRGVLTSAFLCAKRALPGMIAQRHGVIINISSVNASMHFGNDAYSSGKAGLESLTRSIAVRHGPHGIRCNAIAPGTVNTGAWASEAASDPELLARVARRYPLRRIGTVEDVACATAFLASEEASWITGVVLPVDGGLLAGNAELFEG